MNLPVSTSTVVTCGMSLSGAALAIGMVASGSTAFTTASTVAAAATIGSAIVLEGLVVDAAINSSSIDEFMERGDWTTVASTAGGALVSAGIGALMYHAQNPNPSSNSATSGPCEGTNQREHKSGVTSPRKITMENGTYTQYDNQGNIYSYTDFVNGKQNFRVDVQGNSHAGWLPHVHVYSYNEYGQPNGEIVYNIFGEIISK